MRQNPGFLDVGTSEKSLERWSSRLPKRNGIYGTAWCGNLQYDAMGSAPERSDVPLLHMHELTASLPSSTPPLLPPNPYYGNGIRPSANFEPPWSSKSCSICCGRLMHRPKLVQTLPRPSTNLMFRPPPPGTPWLPTRVEGEDGPSSTRKTLTQTNHITWYTRQGCAFLAFLHPCVQSRCIGQDEAEL